MSNASQICQFCLEASTSNQRKYFRLKNRLDGSSFVTCKRCIKNLYDQIEKMSELPIEKLASSNNPNLSLGSQSVSPRDVFEHLNRTIIGQESAKRALSVAVFQHLERLKNPSLTFKSNILLVGPTGSGKTELARSVASFLQVPFVQIDTTTITPRGYIGDSPEICIERLLAVAKGNVGLAEQGIIFLDEFDKVPSGSDVGSFKSKLVQGELLRQLEGEKVEVSTGGDQPRKVIVDTSKILYIAAGSFAGLEALIADGSVNSIGFSDSPMARSAISATDLSGRVQNKHFEAFGILPEILGRLPILCFTNSLTIDEMTSILTDPEDSIVTYYRALFASRGVKLNITQDCLRAVAALAIEEKLGARGLKKHLESRFKDLLFDIDSYVGKDLLVTALGFEVEANVLTAEQA